MAKTKAIEFGGRCSLGWCKRWDGSPDAGGVAIVLGDDIEFDSEMVCCPCALRLAKELEKRVAEVAEKQANGLEYRNDKWRKKRATVAAD